METDVESGGRKKEICIAAQRMDGNGGEDKQDLEVSDLTIIKPKEK